MVLGPGSGRWRVRFPARTSHFWGVFWSGRGHFFVNVGRSWDVSGSGLGTFSDGFGMVLEKMSDEVGTFGFRAIPESGLFRIAFLANPRANI